MQQVVEFVLFRLQVLLVQETLVSQALIDMKISHKEFNVIIREKEKYERVKENLKNVSEHSSAEKQENVRLNSVNSKK